MDLEEKKKKVKSDHKDSVGRYDLVWLSLKEERDIFFQLKITVSGFVFSTFILTFSDLNKLKLYSTLFKINLLILVICIILLISEEIWRKLNSVFKSMREQEELTILTNIRSNCVLPREDENYEKFNKLGYEAEELYNSKVPIFRI
jgi:hypothetical protein